MSSPGSTGGRPPGDGEELKYLSPRRVRAPMATISSSRHSSANHTPSGSGGGSSRTSVSNRDEEQFTSTGGGGGGGGATKVPRWRQQAHKKTALPASSTFLPREDSVANTRGGSVAVAAGAGDTGGDDPTSASLSNLEKGTGLNKTGHREDCPLFSTLYDQDEEKYVFKKSKDKDGTAYAPMCDCFAANNPHEIQEQLKLQEKQRLLQEVRDTSKRRRWLILAVITGIVFILAASMVVVYVLLLRPLNPSITGVSSIVPQSFKITFVLDISIDNPNLESVRLDAGEFTITAESDDQKTSALIGTIPSQYQDPLKNKQCAPGETTAITIPATFTSADYKAPNGFYSIYQIVCSCKQFKMMTSGKIQYQSWFLWRSQQLSKLEDHNPISNCCGRLRRRMLQRGVSHSSDLPFSDILLATSESLSEYLSSTDGRKSRHPLYTHEFLAATQQLHQHVKGQE